MKEKSHKKNRMKGRGLIIAVCVLAVCVIAAPATVLYATDLSNYDITMNKVKFSYTGDEIIPKISISGGLFDLEEGEDYSVEVKDNEEVGTAKVVVKGEGPFRGEVLDEFEITQAAQKIKGEDEFKENIAEDFSLEQDAETKLAYKSSDEDIVQVDEEGNITAVAPGKVKITIDAEETESYKSASKEVTVEITETPTQEAIRETLEWARAIAADNSYVYGHGPCPNCHSAAKVYDCVGFVVASYWHGGEVESIHNRCVSHRGVGSCKSYMAGSSDWKSLGYVSPSNLEPGDVLFYSSKGRGWHHVEIYDGDGKVVGAHSRKYDITEKTMSGFYASYDAVYRYVGE